VSVRLGNHLPKRLVCCARWYRAITLICPNANASARARMFAHAPLRKPGARARTRALVNSHLAHFIRARKSNYGGFPVEGKHDIDNVVHTDDPGTFAERYLYTHALSLSLSLALSISLSLSIYIYMYIYTSLSISFSLSLFLSLSIFLSPSLCLTHAPAHACTHLSLSFALPL
jgi:hypothetical protein